MAKKDIETALIRNKANRMRAVWLAHLSDACGQEFTDANFLPLADTAKLRERFYAIVTQKEGITKRWWSVDEMQNLCAFLSQRAEVVGTRTIILFSSADNYLGAVRLPASCVLLNALKVWHVTEQDLAIALQDLSGGLCLEHNFYNAEGKYVEKGIYELSGWGLLLPT